MFKIENRPDNILEINPIRDNDNLTHIEWIERDRTSKKQVFYRKYEVNQGYDLSYIKIEEDKDSIINYDRLDAFENNRLMFIIENEQDIDIAIKDNELRQHIVLCEIYKVRNLRWYKNIFTKKVKTDQDAIRLHFHRSIFLEEVNIYPAIIKGEIFISNNIFQENFRSNAVCSSGKMQISGCICYKNFIIFIITALVSQEYKNNSGFQKCDFSSLIVYGSVYINDLLSSEDIILYDTKVYNELRTLNITTKILDISGSEINCIGLGKKRNQIEKINYENSTIKSANSYQDFTYLKNIAIANRDNIQALEYHKKEMNTHLWELWEHVLKCNFESFKTPFNFIILGFECISSSYGTSYIRVIVWLFVLHIISGLFLYDGYEYLNNVGWTVGNFSDIIFISLKNYNPFNNTEIKGTFGWIVILKHILNYILIYELIKSFRKYSRKL